MKLKEFFRPERIKIIISLLFIILAPIVRDKCYDVGRMFISQCLSTFHWKLEFLGIIYVIKNPSTYNGNLINLLFYNNYIPVFILQLLLVLVISYALACCISLIKIKARKSETKENAEHS